MIAQANTPIDAKTGRLKGPEILCRTQAGQYVTVGAEGCGPRRRLARADLVGRDGDDPFLDTTTPNRALMGSNMQRQAVPLLMTDAPLSAPGWSAARRSTPATWRSPGARHRSYVDAEQIVVDGRTAPHEYQLQKFMRSNQGTLIHQKPLVDDGTAVQAGEVLADGSASDLGEMALGKNLMVAFMSWEGYNFEDAIILSKRLV